MSKKSKRGLPRWMDAHIKKCKQAFGLWDWRIDVSRVANLKREGEKCLGFHTTTYQTLESDIEYEAKLRGDSLGHDVVTHEMLHVALIEPDMVVKRIIQDFVPKKHRAHCERLYDSAKEHTIEKMSRHISPMLRTVAPGKDE